jgi:hypothetical protein
MGLDEIEQRRKLTLIHGDSQDSGVTSLRCSGHDVDNFGDAVTQLQLYLNGSQSNYSFVSFEAAGFLNKRVDIIPHILVSNTGTFRSDYASPTSTS